MGKILMGAALGLFVGAFTVELIHRLQPGALKSVGDGLGKFGSSLADAFKAGYDGLEKQLSEPPQAPPAPEEAAS